MRQDAQLAFAARNYYLVDVALKGPPFRSDYLQVEWHFRFLCLARRLAAIRRRFAQNRFAIGALRGRRWRPSARWLSVYSTS